jgi:hypothetical protein
MANYTAVGSIAVAATKTALILGATAATRFRITAFSLSTAGTPTSDQGVEVQVRRATALGTSTAVTPGPCDPADPASVFTAGSNCTVEPTYSTGSLLDRAFNPRATIQWAAYDPRSELVAPATANNGIGFQCVGAGGAAGNFLVDAMIIQ